MFKRFEEIWEMSLAWMVTFMLFGGLLLIGLPLSYFLPTEVPQTVIEEAGGQDTMVYIDPSLFDPKAKEEVVADPNGVENPIEDGEEGNEDAIAELSEKSESKREERNNLPEKEKTDDSQTSASQTVAEKTATEEDNKTVSTSTKEVAKAVTEPKKEEIKPVRVAKKEETNKNTITSKKRTKRKAKRGKKLKGKLSKRTKRFVNKTKTHKKIEPITRTWSSKGKGSDRRNRCIPNKNKKIKQLGQNKYQVARSLVKPFMYNPVKANKLAKAKWSVNRKNKKVGVKLTRLRCKSPLHLLGLKKGDVILSVNGKKVNSNMRALKAYNKARKSSTLKLIIKRKNKNIRIDYRLMG